MFWFILLKILRTQTVRQYACPTFKAKTKSGAAMAALSPTALYRFYQLLESFHKGMQKGGDHREFYDAVSTFYGNDFMICFHYTRLESICWSIASGAGVNMSFFHKTSAGIIVKAGLQYDVGRA